MTGPCTDDLAGTLPDTLPAPSNAPTTRTSTSPIPIAATREFRPVLPPPAHREWVVPCAGGVTANESTTAMRVRRID